MWMSHPDVVGVVTVADSAFYGGWDTLGWVADVAPEGPPLPDAGWPVSEGEVVTLVGAAVTAQLPAAVGPAVDVAIAEKSASDSSTYVPAFVASGAGIDPTGAADSTTAVQAKINAAETAGGVVYFPPGTYKVTGLLVPSKVTLQGPNAGAQIPGPSKILYAGTAGGTVIGPKIRTTDTINTGLKGLMVDGAGLAAIGIDLYRTSYSRLQDCAVYGIQAGGVGVLLDANVSNKCYFNTVDGMKLDGCPTGVRFQNGANANRWEGGAIKGGGTAMEFLTLSAGNVVIGTDLEDNTVKHVYADAASNVFFGLHMEVAPIGFDITANGSQTRRIGTTFASSVVVYVQDVSLVGNTLDSLTYDTDKLKFGSTSMTSKTVTTSTTVNVDPQPYSGTASVIVNWFRNLTTTGLRQFNIYKGDGTSARVIGLDCATSSLTLGPCGIAGVAGGLGLSNISVVPTGSTSGGGVLYVQAGVLKYVGTSGTITVLAPV